MHLICNYPAKWSRPMFLKYHGAGKLKYQQLKSCNVCGKIKIRTFISVEIPKSYINTVWKDDDASSSTNHEGVKL